MLIPLGTRPHRTTRFLNAPQAAAWLVGLLVCLMGGGTTTSTAPHPAETYRWHGELVALDAETSTLTVTARLVSAAALADAEKITAGAAIAIVWSGFEHRTDGVRAVRRAGAATGTPERFQLAATLVQTDRTQRRVTFSVPIPPRSVAPLRRFTRGEWITATSPLHPSRRTASVVALQAFDQSRPTGYPGTPSGTYQWSGELVSLDERAGAVTVQARLVTPELTATTERLEPGDPIIIRWSGYSTRANGIRAVAIDDGLWGGDRFLLPATFVAATDQLLTFAVTPPADSIPDVRVQSRGDWATFTSPHRPSGTTDAVVAFAAYAATPPAPPTASPTGTYHWDAELLALDDREGTLTVQSRVVAPETLAAIEHVDPGDSILITWSGYRDRTHGIRRVAPFDHSGLWGGDRFLLPATFVAATDQLLTFAVTPPAESLPGARARSRGDWATFTSPHRPSGTTDAVVGLTAYTAPPPAPPTASPTGTYRWNAELVTLDEQSGALTVKAPVVSDAPLTEAATLATGDPIVITWSGYKGRTDGIRHIAPFDHSGLWGGDRFLLPATFVEADAHFVTFTVTPPADSLAMIRMLTPGDWATVTSPHRPSGQVDAVVALDAYDPSRRARRYVWPGELAGLDPQTAVAAVTVPAEPHVFRYIDRFEEGDAVVLVWAPSANNRVTAIRYLEFREQSTLNHGYILPVTFVAADAASQQITFHTKVPLHTLDVQAALQPGHTIHVTSPFAQSGDTAAILTVEPAQAR